MQGRRSSAPWSRRVTRQIEPWQFMRPFFEGYIADRRANPRQDVLTEFANARYPDGSLPDTEDLINNAQFLFGAGQDTSAKLLGNSMRYLVTDPELQARLREDRSLIPALLEEVLRLEGSTKSTFRIAKRKTRIGDVEVPAGKTVIVALAAANRDPARWDNPHEFRLKREKVREHLAFGRGAHTCIGNPAGARRNPRDTQSSLRPDVRHRPVREASRVARQARIQLRAHLYHPRLAGAASRTQAKVIRSGTMRAARSAR